jgi:hypothetical protein
MLADGAIGFLLEGLIGLGRRDVFVLSPFRGWALFCFPFPFAFDRHCVSPIEVTDVIGASVAYMSNENCQQGLDQVFAKSRYAVCLDNRSSGSIMPLT